MQINSYNKKQKALILAIIAAIFISTLVLYYFVCRPFFHLVSDPETLRLYIEEKGFYGQLTFIFMVILQAIIAFIPGEPLEIAAGYAFGAVEGTVLCLIATVCTSILMFLASRTYGIKFASVFFSQKQLDKLNFLQKSPHRTILFAIIFSIPGTPKDLLCYFAGLTDIKFIHWVAICIIGRLFSIITSTLGGHALGNESYVFAIVAFILALTLSLIGIYIYRYICKRHEKM